MAADTPKLIRCGDHKLAPWCIVCVHLVNGTSKEWKRVANDDGNQDDWLCPDCLAKLPDLDANDLKAICIHCVRVLRRPRR